jgi:integrase/recombinase XerD
VDSIRVKEANMTMIDVERYPLVPDGPLAELVHPFRVEMIGLGYAARTAQGNAYVLACLSRWLGRTGLLPQRLGAAELEEFVRHRRAMGYRRWLSVRALREMLAYLRRVGVVPPEQALQADDPVAGLVDRYAGYLRHERRLGERTISGRVTVADGFLRTLVVEDQLRMELLGAQSVVDFVLDASGRYAVGSMKVLTVSLRSLLRYLFAAGVVDRDLSTAVPSVAGWRLSVLPPALGEDVLAALLAACDRSTPLGMRDYAVLLLMARLGLRSAEIAVLRLEDLDWRSGAVVIHGKGGRIDRLPLPADVGAALVDYLRRGRRRSMLRQVFLRTIGPDRPMSRQSVVMVSRCASHRVGIPTVAAHQLRHRAACRVLAAGGNLTEVAQLLRHEAEATAAIYAKVDLAALSAAARPWPVAGVSGG